MSSIKYLSLKQTNPSKLKHITVARLAWLSEMGLNYEETLSFPPEKYREQARCEGSKNLRAPQMMKTFAKALLVAHCLLR